MGKLIAAITFALSVVAVTDVSSRDVIGAKGDGVFLTHMRPVKTRLAETQPASDKCVTRTTSCKMPYPAPIGTPCFCTGPGGKYPGTVMP